MLQSTLQLQSLHIDDGGSPLADAVKRSTGCGRPAALEVLPTYKGERRPVGPDRSTYDREGGTGAGGRVSRGCHRPLPGGTDGEVVPWPRIAVYADPERA